MVTKTDRELAISHAQLVHSFGEATKEESSEQALARYPSVTLSRDQLKALAFGATLYGFGSPVASSEDDMPPSYDPAVKEARNL